MNKVVQSNFLKEMRNPFVWAWTFFRFIHQASMIEFQFRSLNVGLIKVQKRKNSFKINEMKVDMGWAAGFPFNKAVVSFICWPTFSDCFWHFKIGSRLFTRLNLYKFHKYKLYYKLHLT